MNTPLIDTQHLLQVFGDKSDYVRIRVY